MILLLGVAVFADRGPSFVSADLCGDHSWLSGEKVPHSSGNCDLYWNFHGGAVPHGSGDDNFGARAGFSMSLLYLFGYQQSTPEAVYSLFNLVLTGLLVFNVVLGTGYYV